MSSKNRAFSLAAACVFTCAAVILCGCKEKHDLKGPPLAAGNSVRTETYLNMKDAALTMSVAGQSFGGRMSLSQWQTTQITLLDVENGRPSRARISVERDLMENSAVIMGMPQNETSRGPLEGRTLLGARSGDEWRLSLESGETTEEIEVALKEMAETLHFDSNDLYPDRPVVVGEIWEVRDDAAARALGTGLRNARGNAKMEFHRVVSFQGQRCAEISASVNASGAFDMGGEMFSVQMNLDGTIYRSLETHADLGVSMSGNVSFRGSVEEEGVRLNLSINGPVVVNTSNTITRAR